MLIRKINVDPRLRFKNEPSINPPVVIRVTEFTEQSLAKFEQEISDAHCTGQEILPIMVDSYGGNIYQCFGFLAAIDSCTIPVATIISAKAMSAGSILAMYATEGHRYMCQNATMMLHEVSMTSSGKNQEIQSMTKYISDLNKALFAKVEKKISKPDGYFIDLMNKNNNSNLFLNAQTCKKLGLIDKIKMPSFEINVSLEMKFG